MGIDMQRLCANRPWNSFTADVLLRALTWALLIAAAGVSSAATITVNTLTDELNSNGNCSLREAIRAANLNAAVDACTAGSAVNTDAVVLQNGVTYGLSQIGADDTAIDGDLDIADDLIIIGNDATIDGNGAVTLDRVFQVLATQVVDISDLTITDGRTNSFGGGIRNAGTLTLTRVSVSANRTTGNAGGGIAIEGGGSLHLDNCTISNNIAATLAGGVAVLGDTLTVFQSAISGNTAQGDRAGGIFVGTGATLSMTDSTVSNNDAFTNGGGLFNENNATLLRSIVSGNAAGAPGGTSEAGGGVFNQDVLTLIDSTIATNTADDSAGMVNDGGTLSMQGGTIRGNTAISAAGFRNTGSGVAHLINTTISNNSASAGAGGVANGGGSTLELSNVTIAFNTADSDANNFGDGGGLSNAGTVTARNTLIGENIDASPSGTIFPDCSGGLISDGYNLVENTTGCAIGGDTTGNITGIDPNLSALANNGGPTQTNAFPVGAPPQNAGNPAGCRDQSAALIPTDQRGTPRPQGARCDIGALELDNTVPTVLSVTRLDANPTSAPSLRFTVTFSEPVIGVDAANDFSITQSGVAGAFISNIAGGPSIYVVTVSSGTGNGTVRLNVLDNNSIRDLALNGLPAAFLAGEIYTLDRALPIFANGFE